MAVHYGPYSADREVEYVKTNLVASYDFKDGAGSYPGSGTDIYDLAGDFDMTMSPLSGGPTYDASTNGGIMIFDGSNDYAAHVESGTTDLDITGAMSNEVWVKSDNPTANDTIFCKGKIHTNGSDSSIASFAWTIAAGHSSNTTSGLTYRHTWAQSPSTNNEYRLINMLYGTAPGETAYHGSYEHDLTDWALLTATFDGTNGTNNHKVYFNGELAHQGTNNIDNYTHNGSLKTNNKDLTFAWSDGRNTGQYMGDNSIGAARIYDKELTAAEVLQNFNADKERFGL
jgi:hypothetical protein